ncbi:MAG: tetratricopeptide repeat protein [Planctomycetota bacterium]
MSVSRFQRVKSLFREALDIDDDRREAFCRERCEDGETRHDLMQLLQAHDTAAEFLDTPLAPLTNNRSDSADAMIGQVLGDFRLLSVLGIGGNATVYLAQQQHPSRRVAVKLIHSSTGDPHAEDRFFEESQLLARLDHSAIARVFSSGSFDDRGQTRCWFAMEHVDGVALDVYCESNELDLRRKLYLLQKICEGVAHAHARGVIHRDLKPSNILITPDEDPVIVDFGIARSVNRSKSDRSMTNDGTFLGTLTHMSPEQLAGDANQVTPASDIYSLGVIGYEMVAGRPPLDMRRGSLRDLIERGIHDEPIPLHRINREVSTDLEAILETALRKEADHRYVDAGAMAKDLDDHLNGRGVSVQRSSRFQKSIRFVKRNRGPVAAATSLIAVSMIGLVFYAGAAREANSKAELAKVAAANAQYEADKAIAINGFITHDLMTQLVGDLSAKSVTPRETTRAVVSELSGRASGMFGERPLIEAAIRNELGTIQYNFGHIDEAIKEFDIARRLWSANLGNDHPDTLKTLNNLGLCFMRQGNSEKAEPLFRRTLKLRRVKLGESHEQTLATMNNLAQLLFATARPDESGELMLAAYEIQRHEFGMENKQTLIMASNLASMMLDSGKTDDAIKLSGVSYDGCCDELGERHVTTLTAGFRYAQLLYKSQRFQAASNILWPVQQRTIDELGSESHAALTNARLLSRIERELGHRAKAIEILNRALETSRANPAENEATIMKLERDLERMRDTGSQKVNVITNLVR